MKTQMWKQNFIVVYSSEHVEDERVGIARSVKLLGKISPWGLKLIGFQMEVCVSVQPQKNGSRFHSGLVCTAHPSISLLP